MHSGYSNRHHGVPRSFLGSGEGTLNLTIVDAQEHADFHEMAGHIPPDYFVRRAVLSMIDWKDSMERRLPSFIFFDLLDELTIKNWHSMYQPGTIRTQIKGDHEKESFAKASIHVHTYLCNEQYAVGDAINAVLRNGNISPERTGFREDITSFFDRDNPAEALRHYLLADNDKGDLKWVKPFDPGIRSRLLSTLRQVKPEKPGRHYKRNVEDILETHRDRLVGCINQWQPRISDFESFIQMNGEVPFFKRYLTLKGNSV
jgi:hypothetical protein